MTDEYINGKLVVAGIINDNPDVYRVKLFDRFDDYVVIDIQHINDTDAIITMQCMVCGNIIQTIVIKKYNTLRFSKFVHSFKHCGENYLIHESLGGGFNDYEYIEGSIRSERGGIYFSAKCKYCGHIVNLTLQNYLKSKLNHNAKTCVPEFYNNLIGKRFDDYEVIGIDKNIYGQASAIIKCTICGAIKNVNYNTIYNCKYEHSFKHCKENYFKTMKIKGDYEFIKLIPEENNPNRYLCQIRCKKCGNIKIVTPHNLTINTYIHNGDNCRENYYKELIGTIIDDIQIIDFAGTRNYIDEKNNWERHSPIFKVKCLKCGVEKEMLEGNIKKHHGTKHDDFEHIISQYVPNRSDPIYRRFYGRWRAMNARCYEERNNRYHLYGARGIRVCDRWRESFLNFFYDMWGSFNEAVKQYGVDNISLDRINNDGNYEPENVRWATDEEQANNKRNIVTFKVYDANTTKCIGEYTGIKQYCRAMGYDENDRTCIRNRLLGTVENTPYKGSIYERLQTI